MLEPADPANPLDDSPAIYRTIFDAASDAIFLQDLETGVILDVNRKMTEMYGYSRAEAVRLTVDELSAGVAPFTKDRAVALIAAAVGGTPQVFEWLAKHRDGRLFWVEVSLKRVVIDGTERLLATVRDITDRKRAEEDIAKSHHTQKTLNALLRLALDDVPLEELLNRALALVLHNEWPSTMGVGAVFLLDEASGEIVLKAHNGIERPILESCARVPLGRCLCGRAAASGQSVYCGNIDDRHEITYPGIAPHGHHCIPIAAGPVMLGVLNVYLHPGHPRDSAEEQFFSTFASTLASIILRKRAEESLRVADEQLREQAALVRLGEMAAVVAHEVKNPLAGVRGVIQVIGKRLPPDSRDAAIIGDVIGRLDALDALMQDLLLFSRPPKLKPATVDLLRLASDTAMLVSQDPAAGEIEFDIQGSDAVLVADATLLKIVLLNLMLNAVHAMQARGTVRTRINSDGSTCRIVVADTGPGIPPDVRERIFVPFFTTKARGTGLGLPTARRLVDLHGGRISVDCPPAGGTVVTIELPMKS